MNLAPAGGFLSFRFRIEFEKIVLTIMNKIKDIGGKDF